MSEDTKESGPGVDPLAQFLRERDRDTPEGQAYEAAEHLRLGNDGLERACKACGESVAVHRRTRRGGNGDELSYGEIVALSGDFYADPDALFDEEYSRLPWLTGDNDIPKLRKIFASELTWLTGEEVIYPDNNLVFWWSAKNYLELARDNVVHFGWHNVLAYCRHHEAALALAVRARATGDEALWRRAIYTNGFADHFLTDGFAAGHIRVPRAQTRAWARATGRSDTLAGALSMLIHDQDGHITTIHGLKRHEHPETDALRVCNSRGESWYTRCDGQLVLGKGSGPAYEQPVAAVAASCGELLRAYRQGEAAIPPGIFAALEHVPFPHPELEPLSEKFSPTMDDGRLDQLMDSVRWYSKIPWIGPGLNREHVLAYLEALPDIMQQFREDVGATPLPTLARIPQPYIDAFRRIA